MKNQTHLFTAPHPTTIGVSRLRSKSITCALFAFSFFLIQTKNVFSQFKTGYPTATTTTVNSSTIYYMDAIRAHANNVYYVSSTITGIDIDHKIGSFTVGDRVMVIQMISSAGTTTGFFQESTIIGISNLTNTLQVDKLTRSFITSSSVSTARVQVLKIPQLFKLINKGVIRCHKWDGYTGGVLCFAAEKIEMDGGVFDASGTGFGPDNVNWAIKGIPGTGDNYYNGGGGLNSSSNEKPCINPEPDAANQYLGNIGTAGDPVPSTSWATGGTPTSLQSSTSAYDYGSPSFTTHKVVMGSAGYFPTGQNAGTQGQGGGHGGNGGSTNASSGNLGSNGLTGGDASPGGDAGKGARGGGIILIKVGLIYNDATANYRTTQYNFLLAAGSNGDHGKSGGSGGMQGRGGNGGMGEQVGMDIYYSGGNGGNGDFGKAGQGGDGGNGGKAGTIFIYNRDLATWDCFAVAPSPRVGSVDLSSGKGGDKGKGGYTKKIEDNLATYPPTLTTPYALCTPNNGAPQDLNICHCDYAMLPFVKVNQNSYATQALLSGNKYTWNYSGHPNFKYGTIVYDRSTGELVTTSHLGGNTNTYHCKFYKLADANYIFDRFSYHEHNMTNNHIVLGADVFPLSGGGFEIKFKDDQNLYNAHYFSQNEQRYILYDHSPNKVYVDTAACNPNTTNDKFGNDDSKGEDGSTVGHTPEDVPFDLSDLNSHFGFNLNEPYRQKIKPADEILRVINLNDNQFQMIVAENKEIELSRNLQVELVDLSGKVLWTRSIESNEKIIIDNIAKGIYLLRINNTYNKRIIIK